MAQIVYILCALMSLACAFMLYKGYRTAKTALLLWSCLCFGLLAVNNIVLLIDLVILPQTDFSGLIYRNVIGAGAGALLLFGLIWELS